MKVTNKFFFDKTIISASGISNATKGKITLPENAIIEIPGCQGEVSVEMDSKELTQVLADNWEQLSKGPELLKSYASAMREAMKDITSCVIETVNRYDDFDEDMRDRSEERSYIRDQKRDERRAKKDK